MYQQLNLHLQKIKSQDGIFKSITRHDGLEGLGLYISESSFICWEGTIQLTWGRILPVETVGKLG